MTNTIKHHLNDATLMSYAAGSLPDTLAAVVAAHIAVCPVCAQKVRELEFLGGLLFENLETEDLDNDFSPEIVEHQSPSISVASENTGKALCAKKDSDVPAPLRPYIGDSLDDIQWKRLGIGIWHAHLGPKTENSRGDLRLIKVAPGQTLPEHTHGGTELTLVLRGSYKDEIATFGPGDIEDVDSDTEHQPVSDPETGCICLIASETPAKYKGLVPRLVQPLTGL